MAERVNNITVSLEVDTNKGTHLRMRTGLASLDEVAAVAQELVEEVAL